MKGNSDLKKLYKQKRYPLVFATIVAFAAVCTAGVSTFAWFQAEANVNISTATPAEAEVTVAAPESAKFYYFKGNGAPGTSGYTGYSASGATIGNTTNVVTTGATPTYNIGSGAVAISTFANAWQEIDGQGNNTANKCLNLSKMRPGCYYSFCVDFKATSATLKAYFSWGGTNGVDGKTGDNMTPKRYVYNNGTTDYPLNLLMAVNGYCLSSSSGDASDYIKRTLGVGTALTDCINFTPVTTATTSANYPLTTATNTTSNHYTYFTIFMGTSSKSDGLLYNSKSGTGASETLYYQLNQTTGDYSALDGLSSSLTKIELT